MELGVSLQAPVFVLQFLEPGHHRSIHAAELRSPHVERGRADAMAPAQLQDRRAGLRLLEHGDDLAVTENVISSWNLLESDYEKIPLLTSNLREDYPDTRPRAPVRMKLAIDSACRGKERSS